MKEISLIYSNIHRIQLRCVIFLVALRGTFGGVVTLRWHLYYCDLWHINLLFQIQCCRYNANSAQIARTEKVASTAASTGGAISLTGPAKFGPGHFLLILHIFQSATFTVIG